MTTLSCLDGQIASEQIYLPAPMATLTWSKRSFDGGRNEAHTCWKWKVHPRGLNHLSNYGMVAVRLLLHSTVS
jgi:hypothetical protein